MAAQARCEHEGADLATILDFELRDGLRALIHSKKWMLKSFEDVDKEFWIGGRFLERGWMWPALPFKVFNDFTHWQGIPGESEEKLHATCNPRKYLSFSLPITAYHK